MIEFVAKTVSKIFGSKSERDIKSVQPIVEQINEYFEQYKELSNDQLRDKTNEFKKRINEYLKEIDDQIAKNRQFLKENPELDPEEKEIYYNEIDTLTKDRDEELEKILEEILPEAFAVMKETARRFSENQTLTALASPLDRELATQRDYISITENHVTFKNRWEAAGNDVVWNMVHYDVQLIGGIVLHQGKIAEMATGEGKTLVSTLPAYLNSLSGQGVHIVTVNDYLARRDAEWNAPLYEFLGITVDCIEYYKPHSDERKKAYRSDIIYGTNNEFGFDYLRDNMSRTPDEMVQKKHHFAMVDEVDSVLIDDARTPLIISGPTAGSDKDHERFYELKSRVETLMTAQKKYINQALTIAKKAISEEETSLKETSEPAMMLLRSFRGLPKNKALIKLLSEPGVKSRLQKIENYYMQDQNKEMYKIDDELYFVIDEKNNSVELTDKGIDLITRQGEDPEFFIMPDIGTKMAEIENSDMSDSEKLNQKDELMRDFAIKSERIHAINQLLKAYTLFEKDIEYIIADNKIKIVDEQTGRVMEGRRYSDGLHQAIEAKENVKVEASTQTYATITLQNYFRMYHKLAGMTGTAETEAGEFWEIYKLDVVVIPTNEPVIRDDRDDLVYKTKREKYNNVIEEIEKLVTAGRPVLVGTTSVEVSELLSRMLKLRKIKHNVLNAKQHQREAEIVAEAGKAGTVTIATNMAGRGTDIKLGPGVKEAGGLAIVGTERHESRRVDRQLRGRAGRQGDPGSSQFFVSLEDNLMRLFGSERIAKYMDRMGIKEGEVIQHSLISKSIERAQKKVEQNNFGIRKRLLEYDDVMNSQRDVIYTKRKNALYGERLAVDLNNMLIDICEDIVANYQPTTDYEGFKLEILRVFATNVNVPQEDFLEMKAEDLSLKLYKLIKEDYRHKTSGIAAKAWPVIKQVYEDKKNQYKNIVVPFTNGSIVLQVVVDLEKAYETEAKELLTEFEKMSALAIIDDTWKEHLREMDDLKQSVQNAYLEQKDPLLIYKFEAFKLFQTMLGKVNRDTISLITKGDILTREPENVREAREKKRTTDRNLKTSRAGDIPDPSQLQTNSQQEKKEPVRVGEKVGRNDPCPCGSGKKYKHCHGR